MRVALLLLSALVCLGFLSGSALAQEPSPTPPPTPPPLPTSIGPGSTQPPPPPVLPKKGKKKGKGGSQQGGKGKKGGKDGSKLKRSCGAFEFVQTYTNWGPALAYGRPVTVSYTANRCSRPRGEALDLSVEGTATMHDVPLAGGALIESKPFSVTGTWRKPGNAQGWPPEWWSCGVKAAQYTWEIADIYSFSVTARDGLWGLNVATQGATPKTITWSYDAC